jgi:hypothetical protein
VFAAASALVLGLTPAAVAAPARATTVPGTPTFSASTPLDPPARRADVYCLPGTTLPGQPGVKAFRAMVLDATGVGSDGGIARACGSRAYTSDHEAGSAWDWMVHVNDPRERAAAESVLAWLLEPVDGVDAMRARRLGITYIIWADHIWSPDRGGWGVYTFPTAGTSCPSAGDTACHRDHVHFSFSAEGARGTTSWWRAAAAARAKGVRTPASATPRATSPGATGLLAYVSPVTGDVTGDGRDDLLALSPDGRTWVPANGPRVPATLPAAVPVLADSDGDRMADPASYDPSSGLWVVEDGAATLLRPGGIPAPADYDGDGLSDPAVLDPATGTWTVASAVDGRTVTLTGRPGEFPVPGDYSGAGIATLGTYDPATGTWDIAGVGTTTLGGGTAVPVPADYAGRGSVQPAVYDAATGTWRIAKRFGSDSVRTVRLGGPGQIPVPADVNGDGTVDPVVYDPRTGAVTAFLNGRAVPQPRWSAGLAPVSGASPAATARTRPATLLAPLAPTGGPGSASSAPAQAPASQGTSSGD